MRETDLETQVPHFERHLFVVSFRIWNTLSVYVNMVSKNGIIFPFLVWIQCLMCLVINALVVHFLRKAFSGRKNKFVSSMLFLLIIVCLIVVLLLCLICILILLHTYSSPQELYDGIVDAMRNYSKDSNIKADIDQMQIENGCCGSNNYTDWYNIKWYDANLINTEAFPQLKGETPFSCCSIQSAYPCIHHGVEVASDAYLYRKNSNISVSISGCHSVIIKAKRMTGWSLTMRTLFLLLLQIVILCGLRVIQTGYSEKKCFDKEDKIYTCWIIGCYAGRTKMKLPPPPPDPLVTDEEKADVQQKLYI
ncbi:hypothetical protein Trydic_g17446 [Trypoxylus dichotomus]